MGQVTTLLNYYSELPKSGSFSVVDLDPGVQNHLKALRIRSGEELSFLDGKGGIYHTRCSQVRPLVFDILSITQKEAIYPKLELCLVAPKGDLLWESVTQATEVGATSIRLLRSDYSQYPKQQEAPIARAQKVSDAGCEQCTRAWRVKVHPNWHSLEECLALPGVKVFADEALSEKGLYGLQSPTGLEKLRSAFEQSEAEPVRLFIGPEGGWSPAERQIFDSQALRLGLGPLILRVPTACVAAIHELKVLSWQQRNR